MTKIASRGGGGGPASTAAGEVLEPKVYTSVWKKLNQDHTSGSSEWHLSVRWVASGHWPENHLQKQNVFFFQPIEEGQICSKHIVSESVHFAGSWKSGP